MKSILEEEHMTTTLEFSTVHLQNVHDARPILKKYVPYPLTRMYMLYVRSMYYVLVQCTCTMYLYNVCTMYSAD